MTKRSRYALGLLIIIVVVGLFLQTPLAQVARGKTWGLWTATIARWFRVGALTVPNDVQEQLAELQSANVRLKVECADYGRLREQLGTPSLAGFRGIPAELVARPIDIWRTHYIVNRGVVDGVNLGAPVVVRGSVLVGFVTELHERTAVVQLLFHPDTSLPAEVLAGELTGRGLVRGKTYTSIELTNIPRDVELSSGQNVVTIQQSEVVPPGLVVGTIETTEDEAHEPYQRARLGVSYDPDRILAVQVLVVL